MYDLLAPSRRNFPNFHLLDDYLILDILKKTKSYTLPRLVSTCKRLYGIYNCSQKHFPTVSDVHLIIQFVQSGSSSAAVKNDTIYIDINVEEELCTDLFMAFCDEHLSHQYFREVAIYTYSEHDNLANIYEDFMSFLKTFKLRTLSLTFSTYRTGDIMDMVNMLKPSVVCCENEHDYNRLLQAKPQLTRVSISSFASLKRLALVFPYVSSTIWKIPFWKTISLVEQLRKCRNVDLQLVTLKGFISSDVFGQFQNYLVDVVDRTLTLHCSDGTTFYFAAYRMIHREAYLVVIFEYYDSDCTVKIFPAHKYEHILNYSPPNDKGCNHENCNKMRAIVKRWAKRAIL